MDTFTSTVNAGQRSSLPSSSTLSPVSSMFSRGHSTRSSVSSITMASSPLPMRDSFDLYGSVKRLEDVREEPQEREDGWSSGEEQNKFFDSSTIMYGTSPPIQMEYSLGDQDAWSTTSSGHHNFKRQRSLDHRNSLTDRVANRFGSISRRWKNRSSLEPQLSIVTQVAVAQRSSSATSSQIISPTLSAISQYEGHLPSSPVGVNMDEALRETVVVSPFPCDESIEEDEDEQDQGQATTPLLPPTVAEITKKRDMPIQSPLQSPAIAPTSCLGSSRVSIDIAAASLPSPPLSTRPSLASIQRGRCDTLPSALPTDIPPLSLHEEDPWDSRLGHANFSIHPEPYRPELFDLDSYKEFRENWALARKQYAQHIARTTEHYGTTSRVFKLTQEKWNEIDDDWKRQNAVMSKNLSTDLARLSDGEIGSPASSHVSNVLEKPLTRVIVPAMDPGGKFPEIGDADIVGPLAVAPAKAPELQRDSLQTPPLSPKKRNLFKYLSDVLGRHNNVR